MKILVITPGFLPTIGGAEIGVHEIYSRLAAHHEVTILTQITELSQQNIAGFDMSRYTIWRYRDWMNLGRLPGKMMLRGIIPPFSVGATLAGISAIHDLRPDVVNVHYAIYTGMASLWSQKVARVPTVLSLIGRDAAPGPQVPALWPRYAVKVAQHLTHTIFISEYCRQYYPSTFACTVIPYGVDTRQVHPSPPDRDLAQLLELNPDMHILFSLQRLSPIKRVHLQLLITRSLLDFGIYNFKLLIGGAGPERQRLEDLSRQLGLNGHVRFLGFIPEADLPSYFSLADAFLMTSAYETFGIVLAQSLAAGLPVIAMSNTAIPEVIPHGVCGLLSSEADISGMAENIRLLFNNPELRNQMSTDARKRAEALYDWQQIAFQYEAILEKACQ